MNQRVVSRVLAWGLLLAVSVGVAPLNARSASDGAPASALKAAFLFNFAKFVEWPEEADPTERLALCVAGDAAVADALEDMVRGRTVAGRELVVKRMKTDGPHHQCHLLYVSGVDRPAALALLARLKSAPVFSISDFDGFARIGGIAHFFREGSKMRFAINVDAMQRSRLRISAQVLGLARIVKEEHAE